MLADRRLPCNCDSRAVIIIASGLSSAATSTRGHVCRRRRRRVHIVVDPQLSSRKEANKNSSAIRYTSKGRNSCDMKDRETAH